MSRWEHEVRVEPMGRWSVRLVCRCSWQSHALRNPAVSLLALLAQDHRRQVSDG